MNLNFLSNQIESYLITWDASGMYRHNIQIWKCWWIVVKSKGKANLYSTTPTVQRISKGLNISGTTFDFSPDPYHNFHTGYLEGYLVTNSKYQGIKYKIYVRLLPTSSFSQSILNYLDFVQWLLRQVSDIGSNHRGIEPPN